MEKKTNGKNMFIPIISRCLKKKTISAVHYITRCFIMQNQKLNNIDKLNNNEEHFVKSFNNIWSK